ncbi:unnamed protein product, partial [Mesorhabditis belari]|uniref:protein-tyrosine-phosphatase n=1 Tax=Mesorhabditis belari TaxID=2138241 RepID=A0AAF3EYK1_9BILA
MSRRSILHFISIFLFILLLRLGSTNAQDTPPVDPSAGLDPGGLTLPEHFVIKKEPRSPWSQLGVTLPMHRTDFEQFIAKVVDVTEKVPHNLRDVNRTFLASVEDASVIKIHNLHPGHRYSITIIGRRSDSSEKIKSELITMDPQSPEIVLDKDVTITENNITLRATKTNKAVQDLFSIDYIQVEPEERFSTLEVLDIAEQQDLEIYLGNLNPGREYRIKITSVRGGLKSRPWEATLATKPAPPSNLRATDMPPNCVRLEWDIAAESGSDGFEVEYGSKQSENVHKLSVSDAHSSLLCDSIQPGRRFRFSVITRKGLSLSSPSVVLHDVKPLAPLDFKVKPDLTKGKYRVETQLSDSSFSDHCHLTVISESLTRSEVESPLENGATSCIFYLPLTPGERFEFAVSSSSNNVPSTRLQKSIVLGPAFDMKTFGLNIQETKSGLELQWPQSEVFMSRMKDMWAKIVGFSSVLQLRVTPLDRNRSKERTRQFESEPSKGQPIVVTGLRKGACYQVQIYTVTRTGIVSEARYNESIRMAAPSISLLLDTVTHTSGTLKIDANLTDPLHGAPNPDCQLSVTVNDMHQMVVFDRRLPLSSDMPPLELTGLRPYHKYNVNSQVICGGSTSTQCAPSSRTMRSLSFSTRQDRPGPVQALQVKPLNPYSVQLTWLPPALPNGILTHYVVGVQPTESTQEAWSVNVALTNKRADHTVEAVIDGLTGGETYKFEVRAVTEAGSGDPPASNDLATISMPIMAPPKPLSTLDVVLDTISPQTMTIRYTTQMFDSKNGRVTKSAMIVAEVTADGRVSETWLYAENKTYTWVEVQRFDVWPAYTATANEVPITKRAAQTRTISEVIGSNPNCRDLPADVVCNGPLKPGTAYKFKLRIFTAPNLWTDTDYSPIVQTEPLPSGISTRLIVWTLSALVIVGLLCALCLAIWNRNKSKRNPSFTANSKEGQWAALKMIMAERAADCLAKLGLDSTPSAPCGSTSPTQPAAQHLQQPTFGHHRRCRSLRERTGVDHRLERLPSGPAIFRTPIYTVMSGTNTNKSRPVRIQDFADHVRLMSADSDFRFSEEYEQLKNVGIGQSIAAAEMTVNRVKNRFTNILPYDHSRVKLVKTEDEEGADYINANYMPGINSRREFIAAQGPLPSTRDHFWQMVWEQQCPAIIALTKCVEKGRDKCHQYWPDAEHMSVLYGDIEVTLMSEQQYDEFVVRELRLCNLGENSQPRHVLHLHYMAWPDFGVPDHPQGIVSLARLFRVRLPHSPHNKPTIVHCSAGVGRSGTFMALDRLVRGMSLDHPIDAFGTVHEMRLERCHMVQNEQQYIFIHHCLLFVLQSGLLTEWSQPIAGVQLIGPDFHNGIQTGTPRVEIHQNPAFIEDDEGIAESGF